MSYDKLLNSLMFTINLFWWIFR